MMWILRSSDDVILEVGSIVNAGAKIDLFGDFSEIEGSTINLFGTLNDLVHRGQHHRHRWRRR